MSKCALALCLATPMVFGQLPRTARSIELMAADPQFAKSAQAVESPTASGPKKDKPKLSEDERCRRIATASLIGGGAVASAGIYLLATSKRTVSPGPPPIQERSAGRITGGVLTIVPGSVLAILLPIMKAGCG